MKTMTANIQREWLARIIDGSKKIEYRDATDFWLNRLDRAGPPPFHLRLINGMRPDSPEATVVVNKVETDVMRNVLRFHLADVVSTTRWETRWHTQYPPLPPEAPFDPISLLNQKLPSAEVTIKVEPTCLESVRSPGTHQFSLAYDGKLHQDLYDHAPEPFQVKLSTPAESVDVIVYEIVFDNCMDDDISFCFSVLTPPAGSIDERSQTATKFARNTQTLSPTIEPELASAPAATSIVTTPADGFAATLADQWQQNQDTEAFWNKQRADLRDGSFWADRITRFRNAPLERLQLAIQNLPLPGAFSEAAVATRSLIRQRIKAKVDYADELVFLYWLAAIESFGVPYSEYLQQPGFNVLESIPSAVIKSLPFTYQQLGYEQLRLLNDTDVKWCKACWGEPANHSTLHALHIDVWQNYERELLHSQQAQIARWKSALDAP